MTEASENPMLNYRNVDLNTVSLKASDCTLLISLGLTLTKTDKYTRIKYVCTVRASKFYICSVYIGLHAFLMIPNLGALRGVRGEDSPALFLTAVRVGIDSSSHLKSM
jgi:hypothetical protein